MTDRTADTALQVRDLFDAKAATWSAKYASGGRLTGRLAQLADAVAGQVPPGGLVLDLGCGTGELAAALAVAGMRVVGCDISPQMLRQARAASPAGPTPGAGSVRWIRLDPGWRTLPLRAEGFDAVVASSLLEYVADPGAVLRECCRVLRPGGTVLCTVPDPSHPVRWLERLFVPAARWPVTTMARSWPRLDGYLTYLRVSRNRHRARWWLAGAKRAGLLTATAGIAADRATSAARHSPLRLITFARPTACLGYPLQGPTSMGTRRSPLPLSDPARDEG